MNREKLVYKTNKNTYSFENFQTIRTFGEDVYEGEITFEEADEYQSNLANKIKDFIRKTKPKNDKKRQEKEIVLENLHNFFEGREKVLEK